MFFDPVYLLFMIPGLVIAGIASLLTRSTFEKYSHVESESGMTGAQPNPSGEMGGAVQTNALGAAVGSAKANTADTARQRAMNTARPE